MKSLNESLRLTALFVFAGVLAVGCGSGSESAGSASHQSSYGGTLTGSSGVSGTISLSITPPEAAAQSAVMPLGGTADFAFGTIHITGGGNINVSGTFTTPGGPLSISGGGYTLTGTRSNGVLSGTFTGPGGTSGTFAALTQDPATQAVWNYCGTFSGSDSGAWDLTLSGTKLAGSYTGGGGSGILMGTLTGNSVSLTFANGSATGTLDDLYSFAAMSGTWMKNGGSESGAWTVSGTTCN